MSAPSATDFCVSLVAGGTAGVVVDVGLFPLDTIKTRMQSAQGFLRAGGLRGVFAGLGPAAIGSAPGSALFFVAYDSTKQVLGAQSTQHPWATHMAAAIVGEAMACTVRVPTENVKQKMQVGLHKSMGDTARAILRHQGVGGFWTGYGATLLREVPFSAIQFPLYEGLRARWGRAMGRETTPGEGAVCGSMAGAVAGGLTTPLDVAKTRIMLGERDHAGRQYRTLVGSLESVLRHEGVGALFAGALPRVVWISIGGFLFFGAYEQTRWALRRALQ